MIKKILCAVSLMAAMLSVGVMTTSCSSHKDKYDYMHQYIDLQREYDDAKEAGDSEKMTAVEREMEITKENIKNCVKIEENQKSKN